MSLPPISLLVRNLLYFKNKKKEIRVTRKKMERISEISEKKKKEKERKSRNKAAPIIWVEKFCRMKIWSITTKQIQRSNASSFRSEHFDQSWRSRVFPYCIPRYPPPRSMFPMHNKFKVLLKRYLQFEFQFKIETLQLDARDYC